MRPWPSPCPAADPDVLAQARGHLLSACRTRRAGARSPRATSARCSGSRASSRGWRSRQRRLHGGARGRRRLQHAQRQLEREGLRLRVLRPARRIAEREVGEQQARHADVFDDVLGAAHHHGGDAVRLQCAGGEADALVADGTVGDEDGRIDAVGLAARHDLRAVDLERDAVAAVGRQAVKARRERADAAAAAARRSSGSGNQVPGSSAVVCLRSMPTCEMRRSWSSAVSPE